MKAVNEALAGSYGGLRRARALRDRSRAGSSAGSARRSTPRRSRPSAAPHQKLLDETEDALLAFDAGLRVARRPRHADRRQAPRRRRRRGRRRARRRADVGPALADAPAAARIDAADPVLDGGRQADAEARRPGPRPRRDRRRTICAASRARARRAICTTPSSPRAIWPRACAGPSPSFSGGGGHGGAATAGAAASSRAARPRAPTRASRRSADEDRPPTERELEELAREHAGQDRRRGGVARARRVRARSSSSSSRRPRSTPTPSARR